MWMRLQYSARLVDKPICFSCTRRVGLWNWTLTYWDLQVFAVSADNNLPTELSSSRRHSQVNHSFDCLKRALLKFRSCSVLVNWKQHCRCWIILQEAAFFCFSSSLLASCTCLGASLSSQDWKGRKFLNERRNKMSGMVQTARSFVCVDSHRAFFSNLWNMVPG